MDNEYFFALSTDQGNTFSEMGTDLQGMGRWGAASTNLQTLFAGMEEPASAFPWKLARSNDGGATWSYTFPIDSSTITYRLDQSIMEPLVFFWGMVPGFDPKHYYLMGGRTDSSLGIDDYLYSSDSGITWQEYSTVAHGRVESISNPTSNFLVASVYHTVIPRHSVYADSIFYSTDNGNSWQKDGTTFQQDSIYYMQWFNATNGYVLTYRDSSTWLYHYSVGLDTLSVDTVADTTSHDSTSIVSYSDSQVPNVSAFPDPTKDYVHVNIPISDPIAEMHIYDVMEREVHPPNDYTGGELTIDVCGLTSGSYFAQISGKSGYKYLVRFTREP